MPIRFSHGDIKKLLAHFNMRRSRPGSTIFWGYGKDGVWRTCKLDYHKDRDILKVGTSKSIAHSLKFKNLADMKEYIDKYL